MVQIHDVLHDVQTDARAGLVVLRLVERLEDAPLVCFGDAHAVVGHLYAEVLPVRLGQTGQSHVVLRVFIGVRQQVADDLGHRLPIDHRREVLVGIGHGELLPALLEGGGEAHADILYQFVYVLRGEVHHEHLLFHLAEVEQLVHQFQQSVGIAVDHLHVVRHIPLLHDLLQRADDERHGGADLVGNHREEVQTGLAYLFFLLFVQPLHLSLVLVLRLLQAVVDVLPDDGTDQQEVEQLGIPAPPERGMHHDLERGLFRRPDTVVVRGLDAEGIGA